MIPALLGAAYMGWALGANNAGNVFGTAVGTRMVRFWTAAILASVFVIIGSLVDGYEGVKTLSALGSGTSEAAAVVTLSAATTVAFMTFLKLPVSASQAVVGAILGQGLMAGEVNARGLPKVVICWVSTPIGAFVAAIVLYTVLAPLFNRLRFSAYWHDRVLKAGLIVAGCYGAYALGANNVANVTAPLVGAGLLTPFEAVALGGATIAVGILTFSRGVMSKVGKGLVKLDAFSALVVILAEASAVYVFAEIGVPVSTSQAVVGAVLGIGILKRIEALRVKAFVGVAFGWLGTPTCAAVTAIVFHVVSHLRYEG